MKPGHAPQAVAGWTRNPQYLGAGLPASGSPDALCAESALDARERSTADFGAAGASQEPGCCKHQSSSRPAGGRAAGCGQPQPRDSPDAGGCSSRSATLSWPGLRMRKVAQAIVRSTWAREPKQLRGLARQRSTREPGPMSAAPAERQSTGTFSRAPRMIRPAAFSHQRDGAWAFGRVRGRVGFRLPALSHARFRARIPS